jgi:hypothetical protein
MRFFSGLLPAFAADRGLSALSGMRWWPPGVRTVFRLPARIQFLMVA